MSLLRGGLIDLTIYGRRVASAPRFALMAVSSSALTFLAKNLYAPAVNFTFDVPAARTEEGKLILRTEQMSDAQIKVHEEALVEIAGWLTALCTPSARTLGAKELRVEICTRFICTHILGMSLYVQHLTAKFVDAAGKMVLNAHQVTELVKSCRGEDDALLVGLAGKLVEKIINGQIAATQLDLFLASPGNLLLRSRVLGLQKEMGLVPPTTTASGAEQKTMLKAPTAQMEKLPLREKEKARVWEVVDKGDKMNVEIDGDG
jgi:hypothetical protein